MIWLYSKRVARSEPPQLMSHSLKPFQCHSRVSKLFYLLSMKTIRMVYILLLCKVPESLHEATTFYNCKIQYMRSCNTGFSWSKVKVCSRAKAQLFPPQHCGHDVEFWPGHCHRHAAISFQVKVHFCPR